MRYFNKKGERVLEKDLIDIKVKVEPSLKIGGWAIDINNCDIGDYEEFLRLWMKIKPIPLYKRKNKQS